MASPSNYSEVTTMPVVSFSWHPHQTILVSQCQLFPVFMVSSSNYSDVTTILVVSLSLCPNQTILCHNYSSCFLVMVSPSNYSVSQLRQLFPCHCIPIKLFCVTTTPVVPLSFCPHQTILCHNYPSCFIVMVSTSNYSVSTTPVVSLS
ncbi:hypothetical protein BsWGS_20686 [Bradybaena similaris]